jgi:hypothetical protein
MDRLIKYTEKIKNNYDGVRIVSLYIDCSTLFSLCVDYPPNALKFDFNLIVDNLSLFCI